jgi:hypothetical protein
MIDIDQLDDGQAFVDPFGRRGVKLRTCHGFCVVRLVSEPRTVLIRTARGEREFVAAKTKQTTWCRAAQVTPVSPIDAR